MISIRRTQVARALWVITLIIDAFVIVLAVLSRGIRSGDDQFFTVVAVAASVCYASVGAVVATRRGPVLGWILLLAGMGFAVGMIAESWALQALVVSPGSLPASQWVVVFGGVGWIVGIVGIGLLFLLYPNGRPLTSRWRWVGRALIIAAGSATLAFALGPGNLNGSFNDYGKRLANPIGVPALGDIWEPLVGVASIIAVVCGALSIASLILRYRRSRGDERQQIRWLAYVGVWALAAFLITAVSGFLFDDEGPVGNAGWAAMVLALVVGVPAASAIAILKYRLYELDVVVKKTVVFATLVLLATLVYGGVVALVGAATLGRSAPPLVFIIGVLLGLAFPLVRSRIRRLADRIVYGKRATPYEVLTEFSDRMAGTYSSEDVLQRMAAILGKGAGAQSAVVWLRVGKELRPAGAWPVESSDRVLALDGNALPTFPAPHLPFEVRHQDELLGALSVAMPASDPLNPAREKLVANLATQAGLVLRNVRLIEELRASRARLVRAQDDERRRIERNIHDGAQQQLVAVSVKLGLAKVLAGKDPARERESLEQLEADVRDALETLRDLARGIYPPLLADQGLPAALKAQARRAVLPVSVEGDSIGRYQQEVEGAVYFCVLEALQNVAKYAGASAASVRLGTHDGHLWFEVKDDGVGFDPTATSYGTGLQGMADRLEAIGGLLVVASGPGEGTTIRGDVPAMERQEMGS